MLDSLSQSRWMIASLLTSILVAIPIVFVLASIMSPADSGWAHIRETVLADYLRNTLLLMVSVGAITSLLGVSTAWLTAVCEFPGRRILSWALILPLAAPAYVVAYVYTDLLEFSGPVQTSLRALFDWQAGDYWFPEIRSLPGAALIISLVLYPYVYLLVRTAFQQRSATLFDAARSLGAPPYQAFWKIALPAARGALIGGVALVMMETLADFGVVDYFAIPTFSTGIFRTWFALGNMMAAIKLTAVMFILVATLVVLEKWSRREAAVQSFPRDSQNKRIRLTGRYAWGATVVCSVPVLLGALVPITTLMFLAFTQGDPLVGDRFLEFINNTVYVAALATLICVSLALLLSYGQSMVNSRWISGAVQVSTLGYALPGAMLAIGLFTPVSQFDRWLTGNLQEWIGWQGGLVLTSGVALLVYAYVIRFLTVAYNSTSSGFGNIPPVYSQAARSLGATPSRTLLAIQLPLMVRSVLVAGILVFVDTMRELPATLMLRPFDFETLATRVYRLASDERLAEASTASLVIVLVGLLPVVLLNRVSQNERE